MPHPSSRRPRSAGPLLGQRQALVRLIAVLFSTLLGALACPAGGSAASAPAAIAAFLPALIAVHRLIK